MSYFPSASYFPTAATSFPATVAPTVFGSSQFFGSSFGAPSYLPSFSGVPTVFGAQVPTTVAPSVAPTATTAATLAAATKSGATVVAPTLPNPVFTASAGTGLPASYPAALYASATPSSFFSSPVSYGPAPVLAGPTAAQYLGQTLAAPVTFGGATQFTNAQNTYLAPTNFGASPAFNMIGLGSVIGPRIPTRADQVVRRRSLSY